MGSAVQEANRVKFLQHLDQSDEAVWKVAHWLHGAGRYVSICPVSKTPNWEERMKHADNGDLYVSKSFDALRVSPSRVEVKRRGVDFTGAHDFPYTDFFVCACHAWERATPKPAAIVILNKQMTHAGIVAGNTQQHWKVTRKCDGRYQQYSQDFYSVALQWVKFVALQAEQRNSAGEYTW